MTTAPPFRIIGTSRRVAIKAERRLTLRTASQSASEASISGRTPGLKPVRKTKPSTACHILATSANARAIVVASRASMDRQVISFGKGRSPMAASVSRLNPATGWDRQTFKINGLGTFECPLLSRHGYDLTMIYENKPSWHAPTSRGLSPRHSRGLMADRPNLRRGFPCGLSFDNPSLGKSAPFQLLHLKCVRLQTIIFGGG